MSPADKSFAGISSTCSNLELYPSVFVFVNCRVAGISSPFNWPLTLSCTIAPGTAAVDTVLSTKPPSLLLINDLIANCVVKRASLGPPISSSPKFTSVEISSIATSLKLSFKASSSSTCTLFLNVMLPVLLNAVIKSPTLKSPSSFVPDEYTRPGSSSYCSNSPRVLPPFCGKAL